MNRFFRYDKQLIFVLLVVAIWFLISWGVSFGFIWKLEHRYPLTIRGHWKPTHILPGNFRLTEPSIDWKDRFRIFSGSSGTIDVHFNSLSLLDLRLLVALSAKDLTVEPKKNFSSLTSKGKEFRINRVDALIQLVPSGDPVIHSLEIDSPILRIGLKEK